MSYISCTVELLHQTIHVDLIGQNDDDNSKPKSCDLTSVYFLCGSVNEKCYVDKTIAVKHLKDNIHDAIAEIRHIAIKKLIKLVWLNGYCQARQMNEIIF